MKVSEIDQILNVYKELQNVNFSLDELSDNVHFKQGIKNRTKLLQKEIDKTLNNLYNSMSETELATFNDITLKNKPIKTSIN